MKPSLSSMSPGDFTAIHEDLHTLGFTRSFTNACSAPGFLLEQHST
jgi:hypothetical protein